MVPIRVLHVDDDVPFLELTAAFLTAADDRFSVVSEPTPAAGLDRLAAEPVDCIVSDYRMPSSTGIEFLEAIRTDYPSLPFILFTGEESAAVANDALAAGASDVLRKRSGTGQFDRLAARIRTTVERRRAQQARRRYQRLLEAVDDPT
ncbi:MAG: response regulator [Halohasta sp.]